MSHKILRPFIIKVSVLSYFPLVCVRFGSLNMYACLVYNCVVFFLVV